MPIYGMCFIPSGALKSRHTFQENRLRIVGIYKDYALQFKPTIFCITMLDGESCSIYWQCPNPTGVIKNKWGTNILVFSGGGCFISNVYVVFDRSEKYPVLKSLREDELVELTISYHWPKFLWNRRVNDL